MTLGFYPARTAEISRTDSNQSSRDVALSQTPLRRFSRARDTGGAQPRPRLYKNTHKLSLINSDHIEMVHRRRHLVQVGARDRRQCLPIVRRYTVFRVPVVLEIAHYQASVLGERVAIQPSHQLCRFPAKHGSEYYLRKKTRINSTAPERGAYSQVPLDE